LRHGAHVATWLGLVVALVAGLTLWEVAARHSTGVAFFFASPTEVARALHKLVASGIARKDVIVSGEETLYGLGVGIALGSTIGLIGLAAPRLAPAIQAIVGLLAALPILAVAPMFLIWFGTDLALKVALAAVLSALIFAHRVMAIQRDVSDEIREFLRVNVARRDIEASKVLFPTAVQQVLEDFPAAANAAFLGSFLGEFISADAGIGYRILRSGALYQVDVVLAETLLALGLLMAIQIVVRFIRKGVIAIAQWLSLDPALRRRRSILGPMFDWSRH
jgi:NitT/TauT family transport system permease protein